ncbi:calexcitin-2-like [Mytilus trossulus]|uniref:calexcitin-2-like n=1 Tax=Mytilus trossulus TaxID=6551 RepID=UPI0030048046
MCFEFLKISSTQSARNSSQNPKRTKMQAVKGLFASIKSGFVSKGKTMGIILGIFNPELSDFQKKKLKHEFHVFFDLNKDGILEWKDFDLARTKICDLSGWKIGTDKFQQTNELFITIWRRLQDEGDENNDGKISIDEWLQMWQNFNEQCIKQSKKDNEEPPERKLPEWLEQYIEYKFNLYDRTGDGKVDAEEFEYVLSDFGVPPKDARCAFLMFSCNNTKKVDLDYFKELCIDYYRSDDISALGNFITGKLDFND